MITSSDGIALLQKGHRQQIWWENAFRKNFLPGAETA